MSVQEITVDIYLCETHFEKFETTVIGYFEKSAAMNLFV